MPLIAKKQALPVSEALLKRLEQFYPSFINQKNSINSVLYIGWFNDKPICALWAIGEQHQRQLTGAAVHQANRGRGIIGYLIEQVVVLEQSEGRKISHIDDISVIDNLES